MADQCECKHESKIATLEQRDQMIFDMLQKMEMKVDAILMQVTKVAVLEVKHDNQSQGLDRAFAKLSTLETDMNSLRTSTNEFINQTKGMMKMAYWLWGAMGTGLGAMLLKILYGGH